MSFYKSDGQGLAPCIAASDLVQKGQRNLRKTGCFRRLNAKARVAHFLLELCDRYRSRGMDPHPLPVHLSRQEIADYLGMTSETVFSSFVQVERDNLIFCRSDAVIVLDERGRMSELATLAASRPD